MRGTLAVMRGTLAVMRGTRRFPLLLQHPS